MTLVEMLATLAIVAAAVSLTILSLAGYGRQGSARDEAIRLAETVNGATDAALTSGKRFTFVLMPDRYSIVAAGSEDITSMPTLPDGVRLYLRDTTSNALLIGDVFAHPFDVTLRGPNESWSVRFDGLNATAYKNGE